MGFNLSTCASLLTYLRGPNNLSHHDDGNHGNVTNYLLEWTNQINCSNASQVEEIRRLLIGGGQLVPDGPPLGLTYGKVTFTLLAILIILLTIWGNILVITAVCMERKLRKVGNSFLVNLAISDCLVGCIVMPLALVYHLHGEWRFGPAFCDFWVSMDVICCTASIVNLCVISFDRYNAITQPLQYALKRTSKRAAVLIFLVWLYSFGIAVPPLLDFGHASNSSIDAVPSCTVDQGIGYTLYSTTGAFYVPLVVMCVLYTRVFKATQNRRKAWIPIPLPASALLKSPANRGTDRGATTEMLVLVSATDSLRRQYEQEKKLERKKKRKNKSKSEAEKSDRKFLNRNRKKMAPPKFSKINPEVGLRLMRNGEMFSIISEEDLIENQEHSCCAGEPCPPYCTDHPGNLPQIVISQPGGPAGGPGSAGGGVVCGQGGATCYVKIDSSPMIRHRHPPPRTTGGGGVFTKRLPLMAAAGRGPSTDTTTTTTSDSMDLMSSTDNELNASNETNTSTLLQPDREEAKDSGQSSSIDCEEITIGGTVLQESDSLTSLVIPDQHRPPLQYEHTSVGQPEEVTLLEQFSSFTPRNNGLEVRNSSFLETWTGLPLSTQPSTESVISDRFTLPADLQVTNSDNISPNPLSAGVTTVFSTDRARDTRFSGGETRRVTPGEAVGVVPGTQHQNGFLGYNEEQTEAPNRSSADSKSSDTGLDARRTCVNESLVDNCTLGNSEHRKEGPKKTRFKEIERRRSYKAKVAKRRRRTSSRNKIIVSQEKRAAKTLGIIMGCFVVCWLPFFIVALMQPFYIFPPVVMEVITWLGYFNSLINPGIYTFFNQDFRRAFQRIITCKICARENVYI